MSNDLGLDFKKYFFTVLDGDIDKVSRAIRFSEKELEEYNVIFEKLKEINGSDASNAEKGSSLEKLVKFIIGKSFIFESYENIHTTSNEIDLLVRLNKRGLKLKADGLVSFHDSFLAECKNYNKRVSATWVGKFYSLMRSTEREIGILFSFHGMSGKGWNDATGLTKKFLLSDKNSFIIDFNKNDFKLLAEGNINFIDLIRDKMFSLQNDISINHLITKHPNQDLFKKSSPSN
jgi:hypothetical protein